MSVKLIVGNEEFDYPETGDINFGEEATGWAKAMTEIASEVRNQGDLPSTEIALSGTASGGFVTGDVPNLQFNTAYVQSIDVTGFIRRQYTPASGKPDQVERFRIEGVYNGSELLIDTKFVGDDTRITFDTDGGQITFSYELDDPNDTLQVIVKYVAKTQIDENFFS